MNAIIVEHDPRIREGVATLLRARGFTVHVAPSRRDCFDLVDALAPEVMVLDDPARGPHRRVLRLDGGDPGAVLVDPERDALEALESALGRLLDGGASRRR